MIATRYDKVATPPDATFLTPGPEAQVTTIWLQFRCPTDFSGHTQLPTSTNTIALTLAALDATTPVPDCAPRCVPVEWAG
ncbi:hypothetical protein [Rhodococcus jostii]|uniref:hypothetical protein n=1 Tax=Rhodococcus jostii TaxID=132919 RepID=UPI00362DB80F